MGKLWRLIVCKKKKTTLSFRMSILKEKIILFFLLILIKKWRNYLFLFSLLMLYHPRGIICGNKSAHGSRHWNVLRCVLHLWRWKWLCIIRNWYGHDTRGIIGSWEAWEWKYIYIKIYIYNVARTVKGKTPSQVHRAATRSRIKFNYWQFLYILYIYSLIFVGVYLKCVYNIENNDSCWEMEYLTI